MNRKLKLLPSQKLIKTGDVDFADWNYRPVLGSIQRIRFNAIRTLLKGRGFNRILEVGYGSGIFMPELAGYCDELHGIDVHAQNDEVESILASEGINAVLQSGSIENTNYEDDFFDCVVVVSALEFVQDLNAACTELARICTSNAQISFVTPASSKVVDFAFRILTNENPDQAFRGRRERLIPTVSEHFDIARIITRPMVIGAVLPLYRGLTLRVSK